MSDTKKTIKIELIELIQYGQFIYYNEAIINKKLDEKNIKILNEMDEFGTFKKNFSSTKNSYQIWYSKSILLIKQLLPDRLDEFQKLYNNDKRNIKEITYLNYTISDYLLGLVITKGWDKVEVVNPFSAFVSKIEQQIGILSSCSKIIDTKLSDIEGFLQSELFENEIETAKDILKKKHIRLAGALVGVTLETHLKKVCKNHGITFKKQNPTIADYNEELKNIETIDLPTWRLIQRLGDIRNLCVHSKDRDPTKDEVDDLIRGCEKLIAELI